MRNLLIAMLAVLAAGMVCSGRAAAGDYGYWGADSVECDTTFEDNVIFDSIDFDTAVVEYVVCDTAIESDEPTFGSDYSAMKEWLRANASFLSKEDLTFDENNLFSTIFYRIASIPGSIIIKTRDISGTETPYDLKAMMAVAIKADSNVGEAVEILNTIPSEMCVYVRDMENGRYAYCYADESMSIPGFLSFIPDPSGQFVLLTLLESYSVEGIRNIVKECINDN